MKFPVNTTANWFYTNKQFFFPSEGCTHMRSSLEAVRMTAEGIFIIDESGPAGSAVSLMFDDLKMSKSFDSKPNSVYMHTCMSVCVCVCCSLCSLQSSAAQQELFNKT